MKRDRDDCRNARRATTYTHGVDARATDATSAVEASSTEATARAATSMTGELRELVRRAIDARVRELVPYVGNKYDLDLARHDSRRATATSGPQTAAVDPDRAEAGASPSGRPRRGSGSILEMALAAAERSSTAHEAPAPA